MRYIRGFREGAAAAGLARQLAAEVDPRRDYQLMEFCGGHTHAIFHFGVEDLLPKNVALVHGPGCPVCVLAMPRLDAAIELARQSAVTLVSLRRHAARARITAAQPPQGAGTGGGCAHGVLGARGARHRHGTSGARGGVLRHRFETTTPATAHVIREAHRLGLGNFSVYCQSRVTPAAMQSILDVPDDGSEAVRVDGFIGPSHVSAVIGSRPYEYVAEKYRRPVVIAGFEPLDVMLAIRMLVQQLNAGRAVVENQFTRGVTREATARRKHSSPRYSSCGRVSNGAGLGELPNSGLRIRDAYGAIRR